VTQCHGQRRVSPGGVHGCVSGLPARFTGGGACGGGIPEYGRACTHRVQGCKSGLEAQLIATTSRWRHGRSAHGLDGNVDDLRIGFTPHLGCTWLPAPPVQQGPGCTWLPAPPDQQVTPRHVERHLRPCRHRRGLRAPFPHLPRTHGGRLTRGHACAGRVLASRSLQPWTRGPEPASQRHLRCQS
jgi:hypothetical protein